MIRRIKSARPASFNPQTNVVKLEQLTYSDGFLTVETGKTPKSFPPVTTATAWGIHDVNTGELLWEKRADEQREMASLTKIMTCYLTYQLLKRFNQDPEQLTFKVNQVAARIFGTHAGLRENDTVKVIDLLYGLMLPSGNDCALVLAYGFGIMLINNKRSKVIDRLPRSPLQEFVKEMNKLAMKLGLRATCFTNPHGLSEKANKSTVSDLGKLAFHAMEVPLIQKIVSTRNYNTEVIDGQGQRRVVCWRNTNKLLEKGFLGLKTGTTPSAGLCLSSVLKNGDEGVIVTLLNAKSDKHRWAESEKLAQWAIGQMGSLVRGRSRGMSDATRPKFVVRVVTDMINSRFL